ncbi:polysaccharide pyruvyl transferase family protein [Epilithonimonas sp.]|uniref:polysaccharide pyruvyl transferase family protein n=1 Tax=Epilithonimonas sp. TaxID=2894511 RepID=UPI0028A2C2EE|nr:polysaccharide pyruvyl transferase family protein [Epilithonimonas sp.]
MKTIKLFWYKHPKGKGNFGDELNPYIISRLSDQKIEYTNIKLLNDKKWNAFIILLKELLKNRLSIKCFFQYLNFNFFSKPDILLSIGSVLQFNNYSNCTVWGSGTIAKRHAFKNANFLAVRGKYTQEKLKELGYTVPSIIGDPAVLLPMVYIPKLEKKYKLGIIPHYAHYDDIKSRVSDEILVINLLDDIEDIIDLIVSCELTLSTSLHGIIVSHSYKVPSLWAYFTETKERLYGDNIKFKEYFSSVDLTEYETIEITSIENINIETIFRQIDSNYKNEVLPKKNVIEKLQKNLLSVAPFKLKNEFEKFS